MLKDTYEWCVTGAAGFIGSHLSEELLMSGQRVVGVDNLSTGHLRNLESVRGAVGVERWSRFEFKKADICSGESLEKLFEGCDYVLHQAALGSVPRSIENPVATHDSNATGFLNVLEAARRAGVKRVVYASSSSVYGSDKTLPKVEDRVGWPLSPYAASKRTDELYAAAYRYSKGFPSIGLRYFNVFGSRQDPNGAYAAVIPRWFKALVTGTPAVIYGDGGTSRDFCHVANVVQANIRAALVPWHPELPLVFNVALGGRTSLNELFALIRENVAKQVPSVESREPDYEDFRLGDIAHSEADISAATKWLGYEPEVHVWEGLAKASAYYLSEFRRGVSATTSTIGS
jgi:UDP-N-acetylglucosamine 4-epimerase